MELDEESPPLGSHQESSHSGPSIPGPSGYAPDSYMSLDAPLPPTSFPKQFLHYHRPPLMEPVLKRKRFIRCETLVLSDFEENPNDAPKSHPFIRRVMRTHEVHFNSGSDDWKLVKRIFRLASLYKSLLKEPNPNYDLWWPVDFAKMIDQPGSYIAISEEAGISDEVIRRIYATHNIVVIPRTSCCPIRDSTMLDATKIGNVFNINPQAPIVVQSEIHGNLLCAAS